jgi:hypothetical protein
MAIDDIKLLLKCLSYTNPRSKVILFVDQEVHKYIHYEANNLNLELEVVVNLNNYTNKNRTQMENEGIFKKFTIIKADLIEYCLERHPDVLFLDSDIFPINKVEIPENSNDYDLILSPHFIKKKDVEQYGYYNAGFIWTNNKSFPEKWREFTVDSIFYEQKSLEDCSRIFKTYDITENFNFSWWRVNQSDDSSDKICSYVTIDDENIYYKGMPLIFVHTHFKETLPYISNFNNFIISKLKNVRDKDYFLKLLTT